MSSILKALRRLEDEKARDTPRPLREQVASGSQERPASRAVLWPALLSGAAVALVAAGAWLWLGRAPAPVAPQVAQPTPVREPQTQPTRPVLIDRELPDVATGGAEAAEQREWPAALQRPADVEPASEYEESEEPRVVTPRRAPPVALVEPEPAPSPPAAPAPVVPPPAPEVVAAPTPPEAPIATRVPVPSLYVQRTIWHPDRARRLASVELDGHDGPVNLREGDVVAGLVVVQIDPGGVVFLHRGVELRRRVGARD